MLKSSTNFFLATCSRQTVNKRWKNVQTRHAFNHVRPQIGTMVMQPQHDKARSIKHCSQLAGSRRMSVEMKYDGEYCQVHIDHSRGMERIQIFSKSGKDSTNDSEGLHPAIRESLRPETAGCVIKRQRISEGERHRRHELGG